MSYISFPGLGIEPFHIDKVAFSLFGRDVAWYGLLITVGMVLAVLYGNYIGVKREKLKSDDIMDLAFIIILFGVLGARLYYILFKLDQYIVTSGTFLENLKDTLYNMVAVWNGGLAIYGGIIAGLITAFLFARKRRIPFVKFFDLLAPTVMIGQIIGRWGNFINMEAYGSETDLPWRMGLLVSYDKTGPETGIWNQEIYVHPTFLYESLWNLAGFILLNILYRKKKFNGQMFASYLVWYGFGRMLIEGLRTDSLMIGPFRVSQLVGLASLVIGIIIFIMNRKKLRGNKEEAYENVYKSDAETETSSENNTAIENSTNIYNKE
ncbi:MAG: prolipoprotein diacylglyceryl transferase [Ruminococcaceae bacterium]|nr:prolipoprotein diacylglyceryl transferase [Oscillospiraceae bacterium]